MPETYKDMTDEEAYAEFVSRYAPAYERQSDYMLARILSGRLRDLDKRAKAANARADKLQAELKALKSSGDP
jgi:hypothetical protein